MTTHTRIRRRSVSEYTTTFHEIDTGEGKTSESPLQFELSPDDRGIPKSPLLENIRLYIDSRTPGHAVSKTPPFPTEWDIPDEAEGEPTIDEIEDAILRTLSAEAEIYKRRAERYYLKYVACLEELARRKNF